MENRFKKLIEYSELGYDVTLTNLYGKKAIRMVKVYSYKAEKPICCEQIADHQELLQDENRFLNTMKFLYENIQKQEETGIYYEPL